MACIIYDTNLEALEQGTFCAEHLDPHQIAMKIAENGAARKIGRVI
jgi:hypothetical protein